MKKAKTIRKDNVLCCKGNNLITVIGDLKKPYKQKKKKANKDFIEDMDRKDILLDNDHNILEKIGIHIEERFIGKILKKKKM